MRRYPVVARKPNPGLVSHRAAFCSFEKTLPSQIVGDLRLG